MLVSAGSASRREVVPDSIHGDREDVDRVEITAARRLQFVDPAGHVGIFGWALEKQLDPRLDLRKTISRGRMSLLPVEGCDLGVERFDPGRQLGHPLFDSGCFALVQCSLDRTREGVRRHEPVREACLERVEPPDELTARVVPERVRERLGRDEAGREGVLEGLQFRC